MPFLHNIRTVARYEARTLRRSWFFRLFSIGALFIFTFMNIGIFSPVGEEDWNLVSIPASVPLINLYLLNIGQSIVVIFLAADFLKRDKKLDTNEVLYTRPMSNLEYVAGKTLGILRLFISLNLVILTIALIINIISTTMTVDIASYAAYLLLISIPTILFSLGLAFTLMSLLKNQAITFLLLLGIAALNMFYLWFRAGSLFDYMAFGLPVYKSGMIGFENASHIINQRLLYFCLGAALVLSTVLLFKRLPQSKFHSVLTTILIIIFTIGAAVCGWNTWSAYSESVRTKELVLEINRKFENRNFPQITSASIDLSHQGSTIDAKAGLVMFNNNDEPVSSYVFSLNPKLDVQSVSGNGSELKFSRTGHIIDIDPGKALQPGEKDSITITYRGGISEAYCYPNYSDNIKDNPYRVAMVNVRKRQAFLEHDYVLLTPETHWYPVAALNYYPSNPARIKIDFTMYTLRVKDEEGRVAVSQGKRSSSGGYSTFSPESPMTGITLVIGNYLSDTLKVDSVDYVTYYFPGNDYYKSDLSLLKDTLPNLVSGLMRDLETSFSTGYPFRTLKLVDVPVQFHSYPRTNTQTRAEVQPSMILLPEKMATLRFAGFKTDFKQQKKRMERNNQVVTDKELQLRIFNSFMRNTFISGENERYVNGVAVNEPVRYRLGPSFYFFRNNFYSSEYPVINVVFESHLQQISPRGPRGNWQEFMGALPDNDRANLILRKYSFDEILRKNPGGDTLRLILGTKGDWLFNMLRSKAGILEFNKWFSEYTEDHAFENVNILELERDFQSKFGFGFYNLLNDWFLRNQQPGFIIDNLRVNEIVIDDRSRYQVTFNASNTERVPGLFNVSFRTGSGPAQGAGGSFPGSGGSIQGRGMESEDISKIVMLDSMESKHIGILMDFQPRAMSVNTIFSRNIPGQFNLPIDEIIKVRSGTKPFEGEEPIPLRPRITTNEIIVDNEDNGFRSGNRIEASPLKKLLGIRNTFGDTYLNVPRSFNIPEFWQPVVQSSYYGTHVMSAVYTRAGSGDKAVSWSTPLHEPGYYDIYCYVGKAINRMVVRRGSEGSEGFNIQQQESTFKDMHYKIYHDEGVDEIIVDFENSDGGWNNLGRYYLSGDTAKIELTNQSQGRAVIGDAVRWVRNE